MISLSTLPALLPILAWGDLIYSLTKNWWPSPSLSRRVGMVWIFGCAAISWFTFLCLCAGLSLTASVGMLSATGILLWLFKYCKNIVRIPAKLFLLKKKLSNSKIISFATLWRNIPAVAQI